MSLNPLYLHTMDGEDSLELGDVTLNDQSNELTGGPGEGSGNSSDPVVKEEIRILQAGFNTIAEEIRASQLVSAVREFSGQNLDFEGYRAWVDDLSAINAIVTSDKRMLGFALVTLKGVAKQTLKKYLEKSPLSTWRLALKHLNKIYGENTDYSLPAQQLTKLKLKPGESLHSFGDRIKSQARRIFKNADIDTDPVAQKIMADVFIDGMPDHVFRKLARERPVTLASCINLGQNEYAYSRYVGSRRPALKQTELVREEEPMDCSLISRGVYSDNNPHTQAIQDQLASLTLMVSSMQRDRFDQSRPNVESAKAQGYASRGDRSIRSNAGSYRQPGRTMTNSGMSPQEKSYWYPQQGAALRCFECKNIGHRASECTRNRGNQWTQRKGAPPSNSGGNRDAQYGSPNRPPNYGNQYGSPNRPPSYGNQYVSQNRSPNYGNRVPPSQYGNRNNRTVPPQYAPRGDPRSASLGN